MSNVNNKRTQSIKSLLMPVAAAVALLTFPMVINAISESGLLHAAENNAQSSQATQKRAVTKVPAMRNRVYMQLARAQQIADAGDKAGGYAVLDEVKSNIEQLNSYEKAMLWNFYGFMFYADDNIAQAITSFEQVIAEEAIPEALYLSTTYSLAQLATQQQDYKKAIRFLNDWQANSPKPLDANQHMMFAQVYYQDKQFSIALTHINNAMALATADNQTPKEPWFILQRAAYYELKQPEQVTKVMEALVTYYPKGEYWLQLAAMYGEIGQEKSQLAAMEAAWIAGFVSKPNDIVMLAQLYLFNQLPYKAAKLLDDSIAKGVVVADEKRMQLMAQAYVMAKEDEKAIPVLVKGSEIADDGSFDEQLAQAYLNLEKWELSIASANKALERGGIDNTGNMYLALGMANFNLQNFDESLAAFNEAKKHQSVAKTAKQWHIYVMKEYENQQQLAMLN